MLETPSRDPQVANFLKGLLDLNASNASDLATMMDVNLVRESANAELRRTGLDW